MTSLSNRILSLALVTAANALASAESASAAMVYNGNLNIAIPATGSGVYVDIATFTSGTTAIAGWDMNIVGSASGLSLTAPAGALDYLRYPGSTSTGAGRFNAGTGSVVGASGSYGAGSVVFGTAAGQWLAAGNNYFGFRFNIGSATHYGWGRINLTTAGNAKLLDLAYESVAGQSTYVGAIPAPGAMALLGLAGVAGRRRRRR